MTDAKRHALELAGELSLRQACALCEDIHGAVTDHQRVEVDGSGISTIDLSIVQLLVAAFRTAQAAGKEFSVGFPAEGPLDRLLQRAGFLDANGRALTPEPDLWARKAD